MRFGFIVISALLYSISDGISESNRYVSQEKKSLQTSIADGKEIYQEFCMTCHLANGKGSETVPPLAGSDWLQTKRKESIHAVKFGQSGPIKVNEKNYNNTMPPMGLTNEEVADVMNYVMHSWGNKQKTQVTEVEVAGVKK
jgi:mono/diheme cytochrome c family protein